MKVTEATERGDVAALIGLLEASADPNERDADGSPALYLAAEEEQGEAMRVLLGEGRLLNKKMDNAVAKIKEPPVTREQFEELNRRLEAYRQNLQQGVSWQEVKEIITTRS